VKRAIKRIGLLVLGWGFILLGIVGLFLPVLQGILFILIGLVILSSEYVWAHHLLERVKRRFPGVAQKSHEATARARAWLDRLGRRSHSS
jgi:uncharacterized membrane protein YbaN (DUF454 family)